MFENFMTDGVISALKPQFEKVLEPIFLESRALLLEKLAGPPPPLFVEKSMRLYLFSPEEIVLLWEAACESVL